MEQASKLHLLHLGGCLGHKALHAHAPLAKSNVLLWQKVINQTETNDATDHDDDDDEEEEGEIDYVMNTLLSVMMPEKHHSTQAATLAITFLKQEGLQPAKNFSGTSSKS